MKKYIFHLSDYLQKSQFASFSSQKLQLLKKILTTGLFLFLFLFVMLTLRNYSPDYQLYKLIKKGEIAHYATKQNTDFVDSIDFMLKNDLVLLKIPIQSTNQKQDSFTFVFDTGSPTYFSTNLLQRLEAMFEGNFQIGDEKGNKKEMAFFLTNFKIQSIVFQEIAVGKLSENEFFINPLTKMGKIDGVIGANLMQHCAWQIDYLRKKIYFARQINLLPKQPATSPIPFIKNIFSVPCTQLMVNNFPQRPTFLVSTGNASAILLNHYFTQLRYSAGFGGKMDSLFVGSDTLFSSVTRQLQIGNRHIDSIPTLFSTVQNSRLGNAFLKNYVLTIDWQHRKLYFE
jgi:hypothetical protein